MKLDRESLVPHPLPLGSDNVECVLCTLQEHHLNRIFPVYWKLNWRTTSHPNSKHVKHAGVAPGMTKNPWL